MDLTAIALVFLAAGAGTFGVAALFSQENSTKARLARLTGQAKRTAKTQKWAKAAKIASPVARLAGSSKTEVAGLKSTLLNAGIRGENAPTIFYAAKVTLLIFLPLVLLTALIMFGVEMTNVQTMSVLLGGAALGFYWPGIWLRRRAENRQRELFNAFPDAVDLMVVCVEAGLGLDAAIARTAQDLEGRSAAMAEELHLVGVEIRVGATRERALRNFAQRTGIEEISSFAAMMIQADRFGTGVGRSLRVQSDSLRVKRHQRAEEEAAKLPLKMLFPLIFLIFPSLLLVLLGPSIIQVVATLTKFGSGS